MTIGFVAKQKQLQNFLFSLPSLAFHLKSHKSWKWVSGISKGQLIVTQVKKFQRALIKIRKSEA